MLALRPYQTKGISLLRDAYRAGKRRMLLVSPCGSGKTVAACALIDEATKRGHRCLFVVDQRTLVEQAHSRLADNGIRAGIIMGAHGRTDEPVQVASVQTLRRREPWPAGLVIVDEAHHGTSPTYRAVLGRYADACVIGLTATPFRMGGKGLGDVFDALVEPVTTADLVSQGILIAPTIYSHPSAPDVSGVRIKEGDYKVDDLARAADQPKLLGDIVSHWKQRAAGKRTIVAATRIDHSRHIAEAFRTAGVNAEHADGTDRAAIARLVSGETLVLCQVSLLGEGFDLPALEVAVCARPTASLRWWIQFQGRVMRVCDGKDGALILDHAGNALAHGRVTDDREHSLESKVTTPTVPSVRTCPGCFLVLQPGARVCPECGAEMQSRDKAKAPEIADGQLVEFRGWSQAERLAWYASIVIEASAREYRLGWARNQYRERFGVWPRGVKEIESQYQCSKYEPRSSQWRNYCGRCFRAAREHEAAIA